jgi:RNA polymerase sigma-70 factor (ECF subfamily)
MSTAIATAEALRQQFAELLERHRRLVFKVAGTYARGAADRQDLAQEIAAQLWRAYPSYDPAKSFSTWLYRIALNVGISHLRRDGRWRRHTVPFDAELHERAAPHQDADPDEPTSLLSEFMATLDPLNRALLLLYLEERSCREMAEVLGISETNVSTKINRLKERVRRYGETRGTR